MRGSAPLSWLYFGGLVFAFIGERLIGAGSTRTALTAIGTLAILGALALRMKRRAAAGKDVERRAIEGAILALYATGVAAFLLYVIGSDIGASLLFGGTGLDKSSPRLHVTLTALWPALMAASLLPLLFVEMAYASMANAPVFEAGRVKDAMYSGLGIAGALVFAFAITYVATERDKKLDLSYFRTAKPGEATRKIVQTLDAPVGVSLFFPPSSEVREEVLGYLEDLKKEGKLLEVSSYDHAVDPAKAKELGVSGNGIIVVHRQGRKELLSIGTELEAARSQLRNLDKEIQKRILLVAKAQRTVYLTSGHGERTSFPSGDTDKRLTIRDMKELLTQQGYTVKDLGAAEGLAADVPNDAAALLVIGPQRAFAKEEIESVTRYLDRGGRVFMALDPEPGVDWNELLAPFGLTWSKAVLANDQIYARKSYQPSDKANIATGSYSSHPSVTTLGRLGMRAPMILLSAGSLVEKKEGKPNGVSIDFPVRAHPATWNDLNGNFTFDAPAEQRKGWELAAAVVKKKNAQKPAEDGRALVLADSDAVADGVVSTQPGNAYFVLDGMKWLLGDEAIAGEVSSEADVPIAHTKKQDVAWFYSTIFLAPSLVVGLGFLMNRRRRGGGSANAKQKKEVA
jgi:hypothetical protein